MLTWSRYDRDGKDGVDDAQKTVQMDARRVWHFHFPIFVSLQCYRIYRHAYLCLFHFIFMSFLRYPKNVGTEPAALCFLGAASKGPSSDFSLARNALKLGRGSRLLRD